MIDLSSLTPIRSTEVAVGLPVPWPVLDKDGNTLLNSGEIIESEAQRAHLLAHGFFADNLWGALPTPTTPSPSFAAPAQAAPASAAPPLTRPAERDKSELHKEELIELDSVHWTVGETLYLQVHDNANMRYTVRLIGFVKNKSIMVTAPSVDGKGALIRDGQTFIVRAFPGKKAYAFTASALKSVFSPFPYLHLSYPKQVRSTTIRQGARASVNIIASISIGVPEQSTAATLLDLSIGGTAGVSKRMIGKKGDIAIVKFKVNAAGSDEFLSLKAILRSVAPAEQAQEFRYGFEFIDLSAQSRLILSAFVHQTLAEID